MEGADVVEATPDALKACKFPVDASTVLVERSNASVATTPDLEESLSRVSKTAAGGVDVGI